MVFCHVCGAKAIEGALFCQKCGAKLITDNESAQEPVSVQESISVERPVNIDESTVFPTAKPIEKFTPPIEQLTEANTPWTAVPPIEQSSEPVQNMNMPEYGASAQIDNSMDIYALLENNINMSPAIKSPKRAKNGIILRSGIYRHLIVIRPCLGNDKG